ncbi:MAG TPA: DUF924 family protein [Hyphomonadaceae bacterium]|nr:DUF924 family protein [Hyphomonadaceae bacterium]
MPEENGRILIDDLEGTPYAAPPPGAPARVPGQPVTGEREDWLKRYNIPPVPPAEADNEDPLSAKYVRFDLDETPGSILHYWFAWSADRPATLGDRQSLWFGGGFELDRAIAHRFTCIVAKLASGEALRWAAHGPYERLAAIIALDQFSRSIFRGTPAAFENDPLALKLAKEAIAKNEDKLLKPVERWFLYMPLEHSETMEDQNLAVAKFAELLQHATPETQPHFASAFDYAKRHAAVIKQFGRFPHRNEILGRQSTEAELAFLKKPGSRF